MSIRAQQSSMLKAIFSLTKEQFVDGTIKTNTQLKYNAGMHVYQQSLIANASSALAITFATVCSFIGDDRFSQLVKKYLSTHFKDQYDWGEMGHDFATFIAQQTFDNSYLLSEIAKLDFACHQSEREVNVEKNFSSLSMLTNYDAYQLRINFSAGFKLLRLSYPVDLIIAEVETAYKDNHQLTLADIHQQLANFKQTEAYYLIWRPNFQAQYQQISIQEYHWLQLWLIEKTKGNAQMLSIGQALDNMTNENFSLVDWLPKAIEQQLIHSISTLPDI